MTDIYITDAHVDAEDREAFETRTSGIKRKRRQASEDVLREIKALGYLREDHHALVDSRAQATVQLTFTAGPGGALTVPAGARVANRSSPLTGATVFTTDVQLVVSAGQTATVAATATHAGQPYNVDAGELETLLDTSPANFASVTNPADATGGVDHQLARVTTIRTMVLFWRDLILEEGDKADRMHRIYDKDYDRELKRMKGSGLQVDTNSDGVATEEERNVFGGARVTLRRG